VRIGESSTTGTLGTDVDVRIDNNLAGHSLLILFDAVRFTDNDGTTELSCWQESITGSTPNRIATYWVKVTDDLSSGTPNVFIYYGNPAATSTATSTANAKATFSGYWDWNTSADGWIVSLGSAGWNGWGFNGDGCDTSIASSWYLDWSLPNGTYSIKFQTRL